MPENPISALVKAAQSPALARVSNQLALTDKLLTKPEDPFLIPYRKGNKWVFCDRNKNVVIDCVYDYPRFSDEKHNNWYVQDTNDNLIWINQHQEIEAFITDELIHIQKNSNTFDTYVVLNTTSIKTITVVSANDVIVRKVVIDGREAVVMGSRAGADLYWIKKPSDIIIDIGDKLETEVGADFLHEIIRD